MLEWKKLGRVFDPTASPATSWLREYAQCPTPLVLDEEVIRVYFAGRPQRTADRQYVSYPAYVDLARHDLSRIVGVAEAPLMSLGRMGCFDEFGVMPGSVVRRGEEILLYYTGWTRLRSVPYSLAIGLAVSRDGGASFERVGDGPVLGLSLGEPYFVTGPIVRVLDDLWHMWYLTGRKWLFEEGKFEPVYQIARATSDDGLNWQRDGQPIIPTLSDDECQDIASPFQLDGKWHAVFAWRRPSTSAGAYRLGQASSADLKSWVRDDSQVGIGLSATGWDSQMMCYAQVLEVDGRVLLFYCGNDFGRAGFGIAELTSHRSEEG